MNGFLSLPLDVMLMICQLLDPSEILRLSVCSKEMLKRSPSRSLVFWQRLGFSEAESSFIALYLVSKRNSKIPLDPGNYCEFLPQRKRLIYRTLLGFVTLISPRVVALFHTEHKDVVLAALNLLVTYYSTLDASYRHYLAPRVDSSFFSPLVIVPKPGLFSRVTGMASSRAPWQFEELPEIALPLALAALAIRAPSVPHGLTLPSMIKHAIESRDCSQIPTVWASTDFPTTRYEISCTIKGSEIEFRSSPNSFQCNGTCDINGLCRFRFVAYGWTKSLRSSIDQIARIDSHGMYGFYCAGPGHPCGIFGAYPVQK